MAKNKKNEKYDKYEVVTLNLTKDDIHKLVRAIGFRVEFDEEASDEYKDDLTELELFLREYL